MKTILRIALASIWLLAGPAFAQAEGGEAMPSPAQDAGPPPFSQGHPPLRQDLMRMQMERRHADMPRRVDITPEERRQLRRDIHEANREFMRRERGRHGW